MNYTLELTESQVFALCTALYVYDCMSEDLSPWGTPVSVTLAGHAEIRDKLRELGLDM